MIEGDTTLAQAGRALCQHWRTAWERAVIGWLVYRPGQNVDIDAWDVTVRTGRLIHFYCQRRCPQGAEVEMVLVLPMAIMQRQQAKPVPLTSERVAWWCRFSQTEIEASARRLGDHNPIHYGTKPVVSGFLLLERLVTAYPGKVCYRLRCREPIFADEAVAVIELDTGVHGYCRGARVFELTWEA